jgi:hypothetical protein
MEALLSPHSYFFYPVNIDPVTATINYPTNKKISVKKVYFIKQQQSYLERLPVNYIKIPGGHDMYPSLHFTLAKKRDRYKNREMVIGGRKKGRVIGSGLLHLAPTGGF